MSEKNKKYGTTNVLAWGLSKTGFRIWKKKKKQTKMLDSMYMQINYVKFRLWCINYHYYFGISGFLLNDPPGSGLELVPSILFRVVRGDD